MTLELYVKDTIHAQFSIAEKIMNYHSDVLIVGIANFILIW